MKKIKVDVYDQIVYAFDSEKALEKFCNQKGFFYDEYTTRMSYGCAGVLVPEDEESEDQSGAFFILVKSKSVPLVVHECAHVAVYILSCLGISYDVDNQEPLAYLSEYLFKEYCRQFKLLSPEQF